MLDDCEIGDVYINCIAGKLLKETLTWNYTSDCFAIRHLVSKCFCFKIPNFWVLSPFLLEIFFPIQDKFTCNKYNMGTFLPKLKMPLQSYPTVILTAFRLDVVSPLLLLFLSHMGLAHFHLKLLVFS